MCHMLLLPPFKQKRNMYLLFSPELAPSLRQRKKNTQSTKKVKQKKFINYVPNLPICSCIKAASHAQSTACCNDLSQLCHSTSPHL